MPEPAIASPATALPAEVLEFLRVPHRFVAVATIEPDGRVRQILAWYRLVGDTIVVNSKVGRYWPSNLVRDPRISLVVSDGHDWVSVDGTVEVVEDQATAQGDIAAMARAYETPDEAAESIAAFERQQRISFRVIPERSHVEIGGVTMAKAQVGYAAMLEQFGPNEVVEYSALAEQHGFSGVMAADHFQPWVPQQGQAAFVWNVMTAIAGRTTGDIGPGVTCPSFRMHPAIVAQASATLAAMYPGRHWLGLGSGEALNEHVVAGYWPETPERIARMFEAIEIIRKLFSGKDVKHDGKFFKLETTRLWTMPAEPPPILIATAGPVTAKKTGMYADGLITVGAPESKIEMIFDKCREGCVEAGNDPTRFRFILQLHLSWADTHEEAMKNAMVEWPNGGMKFPKQDIRSPLDFEQMAKLVRPEDFEGRMLISADPEEHRAYIQKFLDMGFNQVYLHNVGRDQARWIEVFGRDVLPKLHS